MTAHALCMMLKAMATTLEHGGTLDNPAFPMTLRDAAEMLKVLKDDNKDLRARLDAEYEAQAGASL